MPINRIEKTRQKLLADGKQIINLSSGNPGEFGILFPQNILNVGFSNFQKNQKYDPDPRGSLEARKAVVNFYDERNFHISSENILLTSGTSESYLHIFKLLSTKGFADHTQKAEILFPNPSYPLFDHIARMAGITIRHYELDPNSNWQINLSDLEEKITPNTRAIVLISPNNPTGGVLNNQTLKEVIKVSKKHNIAIISDEVFSEFMFDAQLFPRIAEMTDEINVFTLNGISKTFALPGLKLSWIVITGPEASESREELELGIDTLLACNQISQTMLPKIMTSSKTFLADYRRRIEQNRNMALEILRNNQHLDFVTPAGGFYLFITIKNYPGTDEDFVIKLMERTGILVHPGYFYDYEKEVCVLISLLPEGAEFKNVLRKFVDFVG